MSKRKVRETTAMRRARIKQTDPLARKIYMFFGIPSLLCMVVALLFVGNLYFGTEPESALDYIFALSPLIFSMGFIYAGRRLWGAFDEFERNVAKDGILNGVLWFLIVGSAWSLLSMFETISQPPLHFVLQMMVTFAMFGMVLNQFRYRIKRGEGA